MERFPDKSELNGGQRGHSPKKGRWDQPLVRAPPGWETPASARTGLGHS